MDWSRPHSGLACQCQGSKFLIAGSAEATVAATAGAVSNAKVVGKKVSKTVGVGAGKGQPKGAQPALYRAPTPSATWSGRGRAPTWLAGATDGTKFLIGGAAVGTTEAGAVGKAKAVAKKPATKTMVAKKAPTKKLVGVKKAATKASVAAAPEAVTAQPTA